MKAIILIYGLCSYFIGVIGLGCLIGAVAGFVPFGFIEHQYGAGLNPWVWNGALVAAWGFMHSFTARPAYKRIVTRVITEVAERSTYTLISVVTSAALVGLWKAMPGYLW